MYRITIARWDRLFDEEFCILVTSDLYDADQTVNYWDRPEFCVRFYEVEKNNVNDENK